MRAETAEKLKNMNEYEPDIPDDVAEAMVRSNLTRGQAEFAVSVQKAFETKRNSNGNR